MVMLVNLQIDGKKYPVIIEKKPTTKNMYLRVKEDQSILITCHTKTPDAAIQEMIQSKSKSILKLIERQEKKKREELYFYFLGKRYDIVYMEQVQFQLGDEKVFVSRDFSIDKWLKKQALDIFKRHLDACYQNFSKKIPYPKLRIRKMKTRWGVCNVRDRVVTLNLELIKKDLKYLDYVIYHELSHLVHPNHSSSFWRLVEENCPNCKQIRKELNE